VIQEVALATGPVQIQCGHNTCDFEDFRSAQLMIIWNYHEDIALTDHFRASKRIYSTIKDFRYSSSNEQQGPLAVLPTSWNS
jgi:hypothetical protein